jgi:hypothetical protein
MASPTPTTAKIGGFIDINFYYRNIFVLPRVWFLTMIS